MDRELVARGLAASREEAQQAVLAGRVTVGGAFATKPSRLVAPAEAVVVAGPPPRFVSRGGDKLEAALARFGVAVADRRALDAGASTGGFTDCLLQRGAASVVAVDVGRAQLHERLRGDPRVVCRERANLRHLTLAELGGHPFPLVVADLSFISLRTVADVVVGCLAAPGADLVVLIKPQFEADRAAVTRGRGVVASPAVWRSAIAGVVTAFADRKAAMMGVMASPLTGADGNVEFFLHSRAPGAGADRLPPTPDTLAGGLDIDAALAEAEGVRGAHRDRGRPRGRRREGV
ncbi:MAG TPA: TlyA family RNA methyltransferase [Acidimicrobiales bacterium]|nr:TlyA family RNA methyltransferase [Acidimicrobiales bacterium]